MAWRWHESPGGRVALRSRSPQALVAGSAAAQGVIYSTPGAPFSLAAEKQIYANHYFEAALDLLAIADRADADGSSGIYLLKLTRYRFDNMPSIPLANVRGKAVKRFRDRMRSDLERATASAEAVGP